MNILIIILCLIYVVRFLSITFASRSVRNKFNDANNNFYPFVSVIIPARNEEDNIENCIHSILNSDYLQENYEVIIVNDRSEDNTLEIINSLANSSKNIRICNITNEALNKNLQGKAGAIQAGIDISQGEIILLTDADCIVNKNWIKTMATHFTLSNNNEKYKYRTGIVCAYTNIIGTRLFHKFQALEWCYMHTYACAGVGLNTMLGCFGNNIAVTKEAYNAVGGYKHLKFSVTEDYVLLKAVYQQGFEVKYLCDNDSLVETFPMDTFREYLRQRKRWSLGGMELGWKIIIYAFSSAALWLAIIFSVMMANLPLLVFALCLRFLGDAMILFPVLNKLKIKHLKKYIPLSVCWYSLVEIILPFLILNKSVEWKGQKFKA